ncbi:MAG: hypothetical protein H0T53_15395 [Herpetosiphonaceae bacterium]|nr:hypothetical protein [Herpetosiphonaceae bacterium]
MSDEHVDDAPAGSAARPVAPIVIKRGRGCVATLVGSALTIVVSAALGAALALLVMWYGPRNFGLTFPDSTGRLSQLETTQSTAVLELTDMAATLRGLSDLRGSVEAIRESVQTLESSVNTRELDLDALQKQISANLDSLLAIQKRLDDLESIPANAALADRIATAEVELATISTTLDRLRTALGIAAAVTPTPEPASTTATPTP